MTRKTSIFGTLVFLFTLAGSAILGGVTLFLFRTFEHSQMVEQRRAISSMMETISSELSTVHQGRAVSEALDEIRSFVERENSHRHGNRFGVAILRGRETLLSVGPHPARELFPSPASSIASLEIVHSESGDEQHFLLTSMRFADDGPDPFTVLAALDQTLGEEVRETFRDRTQLALFISVTVLALLSAAVAHRAMRPIKKIATATRAIDVRHFDQQLETEAWPTELQDLAAALADMRNRLNQAFQRLSQFSADLAHELRTPVNNLLGEAEVSLRSPRTAGEYRETLGSMLEEVQRLRRMIDALLFLARAEHPDKWVERGWIDARVEAEDVAEFFSAMAEERAVTVAVQGFGSVMVDRALFRRALSNLLENALRYTQSGGRVDIVIHETEAPAGTHVEVTDTGAGIAAHHLPHLFDRFYRADDARSRQAEGTGLGLAIVRSIVELHGGSVSVQSELGHGSTFLMVFPQIRAKS